MCNSVPSGLLLDINTCSCDEDFVVYLIARRTGDPIPKNVTADVNPFRIEPWDSTEGTWYLCLEGEKGINGESSETAMRKTENGFWREINKTEISFDGNIGWKNTLEFYEGKAPSGIKTGYMMHEYHIEPNMEGVSEIQDYSSLCRIFWQNEKHSSLIEQQNLVAHVSDKNEILPAPSSTNNVNNNISNNENSYIELNDFLSSSEMGIASKNNENNFYCDFSNGDYMELKDILSSDSGSTSSGNSSRMSGNSEMYFDPDELLRDIAGECNGDLLHGEELEGEGEGERRVECRFRVAGPVQSNQSFSVTGPVQSEQVLIRPEPDLVPVQNEGPSTSRTSRVKRNLSDGTSSNSSSSSNNSKSPQRERKRSVIKLAKLGRKLFCFASF